MAWMHGSETKWVGQGEAKLSESLNMWPHFCTVWVDCLRFQVSAASSKWSTKSVNKQHTGSQLSFWQMTGKHLRGTELLASSGQALWYSWKLRPYEPQGPTSSPSDADWTSLISLIRFPCLKTWGWLLSRLLSAARQVLRQGNDHELVTIKTQLWLTSSTWIKLGESDASHSLPAQYWHTLYFRKKFPGKSLQFQAHNKV